MQISALMEKAEAGMYRMLCVLKEGSGPIPIKQIAQETDLSRSTVVKYLEGLQELIAANGLPIHLLVDEDSVQLQLSEDFEWSALLHVFLGPAVKYQILSYLYHHRQFQVQVLSQKLLISEATLHRHLSALNELLAPFEISIANGHWQGSEHQVRYFYWRLYQQVWTESSIATIVAQASIQREIQLVDRLCQDDISEPHRQLIGLWIAISHARWSIAKKETTTLTALLVPYKSNAFFQRLEKACLRYFSRYAVELDELEGHMLFAFLVSSGVLPHHTMTFLMGFGGPLADQMTSWIRQLREEKICGTHLPDVVSDTLGQILHQQYFFKGSIWRFPNEYNPDTAYFSVFTAVSHGRLVERLLPECNRSLEEVLQHRWQFLALLAYLTQPTQEHLRIGIAVPGGALGFTLVKASLDEKIGYNRLVAFLPYEPNQTYDALILGQLSFQKATCPIYRLHAPMRSQDKEALNDWIKDLLGKSRSHPLPVFPTY